MLEDSLLFCLFALLSLASSACNELTEGPEVSFNAPCCFSVFRRLETGDTRVLAVFILQAIKYSCSFLRE